MHADPAVGLVRMDTRALRYARDAALTVADEEHVKRRGRVGEHDDAAASEDDPAVGRRPGEELGELGAQVPLIEIHALDRLSREHRRRPRQTADEPARTPGLLAGRGQRRRERAVEERHAQRICDARRDLVTSSSMFGRHRDDGEASRRRRGGIHPWQRARTEAGQRGCPRGRCPWGLHGPRLVARTHERRAVMSPRCTRAYTNEFNARRRRRGDRRWGGWRLLCSGAGAARGLGCATRAGRGPGVGCSAGNAGIVGPSHVLPLASPAAVRDGMRWMSRPDSPFYVRPNPAIVPWLVRFTANATPGRVRRSRSVLRGLAIHSAALHASLAEDELDTGYRRTGLLNVFSDPGAFSEALRDTRRDGQTASGARSCRQRI